MKKLKTYFVKSNKGAIIIIAILLLCLYGFTISSFLASVPSEGFSREIEIAKVTSGNQININSHIETLELSDEETLITAVDNHSLKLITISRMGQVVDQQSIDLDLYNATEISARLKEDGVLNLYYLEEDLYQVLIDLDTFEYTKIKVVEDVDYFVRKDKVIIYQQKSGLYGFNDDDLTRVLPLVQGEIKSFAIDQDTISGTYHLITTIKNIISVDIKYLQFDNELAISKEFMLRENTGSSYLKYIKAVHVDHGQLTAVYVWSDNKYGANNVTIHQYDAKTGELSTDYRYEFSLHKSHFVITDVVDDQVTLLFQETINYGVNLVEVILSEDNEPIVTALTKTKKLSLLSKYFKFGQDQGLVFFDIANGDKIIYYASSNPKVIEATTKVTTIDPFRIIGLIFIVIFQAAFTGAVVFILFVAIGPFLLLLAMNKFLPEFKNKIYIQSIISVIIHTGLKIYLTYQLIHVMKTYILTPPIVGVEPYIYIFMIFLSLVSYYLMSRYIKWNIEYPSTPLNAYMNFILFEYVSYTLVVYIYITTYLVISKI